MPALMTSSSSGADARVLRKPPTATDWADGWRGRAPVRLPLELWGRILRTLRSPADVLSVGQVCRAWRAEVFSDLSEGLWRAIWDAGAGVGAESLPAHLRVAGGWQAQVRASASLALARGPCATVCVPPRYGRGGVPVAADAVRARPVAVDVEDALGRATCALALPDHVLVACARGLALLCFCSKCEPPALFVEDAAEVSGVTQLARVPGRAAVLAATGAREVVSVSVAVHGARARRALRWRRVHSFSTAPGALVALAASACGGLLLAGFDDGHVHVACASGGGLRHVLSMREPADLLAAAGGWVVGASALQPVGAAVWAAHDGRAAHRFDRTAVGWEEVIALAGLAPAAGDGRFALWNGKDCVRILCARTGRFTAVVDVASRFPRAPARAPADEAERGAASAHVGPRKMVVSYGRRSAVLATSNRVFKVPIGPPVRACAVQSPVQGPVQFDGALRSLVALSTDERSVVTADGDAFGGALRTWVTGRASLAEPPRLRVWDATTGALCSATELPSAAGDLSVCGNLAVVTATAVGQVVVHQF